MFGDQRLGYSGPFQPPFVARTVALKRSVMLFFFYRKRIRKRSRKKLHAKPISIKKRQRQRERESGSVSSPFVVRTVALKRSVVLFWIKRGKKKERRRERERKRKERQSN